MHRLQRSYLSIFLILQTVIAVVHTTLLLVVINWSIIICGVQKESSEMKISPRMSHRSQLRCSPTWLRSLSSGPPFSSRSARRSCVSVRGSRSLPQALSSLSWSASTWSSRCIIGRNCHRYAPPTRPTSYWSYTFSCRSAITYRHLSWASPPPVVTRLSSVW